MSNENKCCPSTKIIAPILFIFILVGAVYLVVYSKLSVSKLEQGTISQPSVESDLHTSWLIQARSIMSGLSTMTTPTQAGEMQRSLLELRVAGQDRETHLQLVLLLGDLERGDTQALEKIESILSSLK